jgi:phosphopantetheinyl transferase (holo-ACP synthase)
MKPKIILKKIKNGSAGIKQQRAMADSLIARLTGEKPKRSRTGRPFLNQAVDLSVSHKEDLVCVGTVPEPYKIGVDVEHLNASINAKLFLGPVITRAEFPLFEAFCKNSDISVASGVAIFWSIKEAFFKCLDYDLKPRKINILDISKNRVKIGYSEEITRIMKERELKLHSLKIAFDCQYVYSEAVMKGCF